MKLARITEALLMLMVVALAIPGCKRGNTITLTGSTTIQPVAEKLAGLYMKAHPGTTINIEGGGSAAGIKAVLEGDAQIAMAGLVELPKEASTLKQYVIAKDGICIIVNPKNRVAGLTPSQIREALSGRIATWKELGGDDKPINIITRKEGSGTRSSLDSLIRDIKPAKNMIVKETGITVREAVANDVNAIGYISCGQVNDTVKTLSVDGIACTAAQMAKKNYKLVRPLFFLIREDPAGLVKGFLEFVLSGEGQGLLAGEGLIPVTAQ